MKKHCRFGLALISLLTLASCSTNPNGYFQSQVQKDLLKETWIKQVNLDPNKWTASADSWFVTGEPLRIEDYAKKAPYSKAITTEMVRVPNFTNVNIDGGFKVQFVGRQQHNSVFIIGPNDAVRQTAVKVSNHTLFISQIKNDDTSTPNTNPNDIIVRIGIKNLRSLVDNGDGNVSGREVTSDGLRIISSGNAPILLSGSMNLTQVNQLGAGTITVIGAYTPALKINAPGNGNVNINGRVGVQSINHKGNGKVSIIGADSDALTIYASGSGTTTVAGYANLKKVSAFDDSRVYLYWVSSNGTYVYAQDNARIGLAGNTANLNIDIKDNSRFEGQYLHGNDVYVRTRSWSHANVNADKKMFAAALDDSSIYFFGSPNVLSRYVSENGAVIPVWNDTTPPPLSLPYSESHNKGGSGTWAQPVMSSKYK